MGEITDIVDEDDALDTLRILLPKLAALLEKGFFPRAEEGVVLSSREAFLLDDGPATFPILVSI